MRTILAWLLVIFALAGATGASAQDLRLPLDLSPRGRAPEPATPPAARPVTPADRATGAMMGTIRVVAHYYEGGAAIPRGMTWRVHADAGEGPSGLRLIAESAEAQPSLRVPPGSYFVTAIFGRASVTRRVEVGTVPVSDTFIMNAGGLRVVGAVGERRIADQRLVFTVTQGPGPGGVSVLEDARGGRILRLPVGDYYVVSRFGDANAIQAGDVRVQPGRLTDVVMHHRAAQVTLKLVNEAGGEAIANTAWSVLTPGGDTVQESIGAFPTMVLAAGAYTVIARNEGRVFTSRFEVESGRDREVEVLTR